MSKPKTGSYSGAVLRMARDERMKAAADPAEQTRRVLEGHERVIENARRSFVAMGQALLAIRTERLYAGEYSTFAEYCEARWDVSEAYANRVINAALVAIKATPIGVEINSEAQARELADLADEPEQLRQIWDEASRRAAGGRVTAALIKEVRKALDPPAPEALEGEVVENTTRSTMVGIPTTDDQGQTSGPAATSPAGGSGTDRPASSVPGEAGEGGTSPAADVNAPSAPQTGDHSSPGEFEPVDEPEQPAAGVSPAAPDLVKTPIGPMTREFAEKLDQLVPDPNPHREWQKQFLDDVHAAARLMRKYEPAEIAEKADAELLAEFASLAAGLGERQQLVSEALNSNVRPLRSVK